MIYWMKMKEPAKLEQTDRQKEGRKEGRKKNLVRFVFLDDLHEGYGKCH